MNKIILIVAITMGFALTASAQRKHHSSHNGHSSHSSHSSSNKHYSHRSHRSHSSHSRYSSGGHYSYVTRKVWVPGCSTRVWIAPRYEYRRQPCGALIRVCVSNGYYDTRQSRGHYDYRQVKVYNSGHSHQRRSGLSVSWRF